jgi:RNA polymerase sigma factor (sigma-70 family)
MEVHEDTPLHEPIADADLILRTRSGDTEAFGELWRRHYPSGMAVARSVTSSIDPDDLVQESYTRIYQAIVKGGGPNGSFRAYLFTSIRNTAAAWGRSRRESAIDELDTVADPDSTEQATNEALDRSLTAQAFRSLPSRWQEVLWYTEIEQMKPQAVAPLLGMKAGAVSQLAFRAREGLREAWIQAHLRSAAPGSDCQWTIEHLGAYSRGNLSTRDHNRLEAHLDECARCMIVAAEAKDVSMRLGLVLLPLVLGITGSAGYLATLQGNGAQVAALAPAVVPATVFAGGSGVAAAGGSASSGSAGGATGAGGAGAGAGAGAVGASGGILTGMGALVGAGSAALVVAGVVAAATIIPGLAGVDPATSLPSAGDVDSSSIASDIIPDPSMNAEKPLVVEEPTPAPDEKTVPPADDGETDAPHPTAPVTPPPVTTPPPPTTPPAPPAPEEPETPAEPETPTEPTDPGPAIPTVPPTVGTATLWLDDALVLHYRVPVQGLAGNTIEAFIDDGGGGQTITLDENGAGTIDLRPTLRQLLSDETVVTFRYVLASGTAPMTTKTLWGLAIPPEPEEPLPPVDEQPPAEEPPVLEAPDDAAADQAPADQPAVEQAPSAVVPTAIEEIAPSAPAEQTEPQVPANDAPPAAAAPALEEAASADEAPAAAE